MDKWSTYSCIKKRNKNKQKSYIKDTKTIKKDTKDIHKNIFNFQLISSGKLGDKMRPSPYLGINVTTVITVAINNGTELASSTMLVQKKYILLLRV